MGHHDLKTWPVAFDAVVAGIKRHEIRTNDRGFSPGDTLLLQEWYPGARKYSGRERLVRVTYVSSGGTWGLPENLCVMSIEPAGQVSRKDSGGT